MTSALKKYIDHNADQFSKRIYLGFQNCMSLVDEVIRNMIYTIRWGDF